MREQPAMAWPLWHLSRWGWGRQELAFATASNYDGGMKHTLSIAVVIILASIAWHAAQWVGAEWERNATAEQVLSDNLNNWELAREHSPEEFEF
jgi:hypothetical protein